MKNTKNNAFSWSYLCLPFIFLFVLLIVIFNFNSNIDTVDIPNKEKIDMEAVQHQLDDCIPTALFNSGVPGMSIAIIDNGEITTQMSYGKTDYLSNKPVTNVSVFEGASLSKPLTAWAILKLISEKKLSLDSILVDGDKQFSIRQLLSHSAGFDNNLGSKITPNSKVGKFSYSGQGYLKLGQLIANASGMSFDDYMNEVVLKELDMANSYFGEVNENQNEVKPHISIVMPLAIGVILFSLITLILTFLLWIMTKIMKRGINRGQQKWILIISFLITILFPLVFLGTNNGLRITGFYVVTFALVCLLISGLVNFVNSRKHINSSLNYLRVIGGLMSFIVLIFLLWIKPPLPLKERKARFSPAAGLSTTARDYAKFLNELIAPTLLPKALIDEMMTAQVQVNDNNDWGLGLGIQNGTEKVVWHWGVNYPGYQALFVVWPSQKNGVVVLMNGGPMSLTTGNPRFEGLELAREVIIKVYGGQHFDYWQGVH